MYSTKDLEKEIKKTDRRKLVLHYVFDGIGRSEGANE